MRLVILESPYAGNIDKNVEYAKACMLDSFSRGEYPFASHLLYTQVLNDNIPDDRALGIAAGLEWGKHAEATVVYLDYGISEGMKKGIENAKKEGRKVMYRNINR